MTDKTQEITFRAIAKQIGLVINEPLPQDYPLEQWFSSVYDRPLSDFSEDDLAIACRQEIFPEYVVPYCLTILGKDPSAGARYDGELLLSLKNIPSEIWRKHNDYKTRLIKIAKAAYEATDDKDLHSDIDELINRIGQ